MRSGHRLDLAIGIVLGLAIGLAVAYLLVFVIGGGSSGSGLSTDTTAPRESTTKTAPSGRAAPQPPGRRR